LILALAIFVGFAGSTWAANEPTIYLDPIKTSSDEFIVYVKLRDWDLASIDRVYSFGFHIAFDPAAVEVTHLEEGADIVARAPNYVIGTLKYDNSLGTIDVGIGLYSPAPPLLESGTGEAILAWAQFRCKGPIDTALTLQNVGFLNLYMETISGYLIENAFIQQYPVLVVPEFWLGTVLGLAGCFAALGTFYIMRTHSKRRVV
jgi:hypothetical protein